MNSISDAFSRAFSHELANLRTFDGSWLHEQTGEEICRISEGEAYFGMEVSVTASIIDSTISLALPGERQQRLHGTLDATGLRLLWPSGEVWQRSVPPAVALAINRKFGSEEIQPLYVADVLVAVTSSDRWPAHRAEAVSTTVEDASVAGNNSETVGFDSDDDGAVNLALALCKDQGIEAEIRLQFGSKIYGTVCVMLAVVNIITVAFWLARDQIRTVLENYPKVMSNIANHCLYVVFMGVFFRISIVVPFFSRTSKEGSLASMKRISTSSASLLSYSMAIGCLTAWAIVRHEEGAEILRQTPTAIICVIMPLWVTFPLRGQSGLGPGAIIAVAASASLLCTTLLNVGRLAMVIGAAYGCVVALVIDNIVSAPDGMMMFVLGRLESVIDLSAIVAWDVFHGCLPYAITAVARGFTSSISTPRSEALAH